MLQAAFKRPAAGEVTSASTPEVNVDWDNVKAEDKTLVHQVSQPVQVSFASVRWLVVAFQKEAGASSSLLMSALSNASSNSSCTVTAGMFDVTTKVVVSVWLLCECMRFNRRCCHTHAPDPWTLLSTQ